MEWFSAIRALQLYIIIIIIIIIVRAQTETHTHTSFSKPHAHNSQNGVAHAQTDSFHQLPVVW